MRAPDILAATHNLEEAGMDRSQSEAVASTIVAAVEPLLTKSGFTDELGGLREVLIAEITASRTEFKSDMAAARAEFKSDMAAARTEFKSDMAAIRSEFKAGMAANRTEFKGEIRRLETKMDVAVEHLATKKEVESVKVWLICGLLPIALGIVALMYQINA